METINDIAAIPDFISELLVRLNISLSSYHDFPKNMVKALQTIGELSHYHRIHIVNIHQNLTYSVQHEWFDNHLQAVPEKWKHAQMFYDSPLEKQLCSQNYIVIKDTDTTINPKLQNLLKEQNCRQMLVLPLFESEMQFAFITFMQCLESHPCTPAEIHLLSDISSILATQLNNYHLLQKLLRRIETLKKKQEPVKILHSHLQNLQTKIIPAWNEIKKTASLTETHPQASAFSLLDQHLETLDKICRSLSEK